MSKKETGGDNNAQFWGLRNSDQGEFFMYQLTDVFSFDCSRLSDFPSLVVNLNAAVQTDIWPINGGM